MAEREGFEPSVHLSTHDELATRWFKPAHPRFHSRLAIIKVRLQISFLFIHIHNIFNYLALIQLVIFRLIQLTKTNIFHILL